MTSDKLLLLFFGLPLAILGMGMRRALGLRGFGSMLFGSMAVGAYGILLEIVLRRSGHGLPLPASAAGDFLRGFGLFALGGALLGSLGGILVRFRGHGALLVHIPDPDSGERPEGEDGRTEDGDPGEGRR